MQPSHPSSRKLTREEFLLKQLEYYSTLNQVRVKESPHSKPSRLLRYKAKYHQTYKNHFTITLKLLQDKSDLLRNYVVPYNHPLHVRVQIEMYLRPSRCITIKKEQFIN